MAFAKVSHRVIVILIFFLLWLNIFPVFAVAQEDIKENRMVEVLVQFRGDLSPLVALGGKVRGILGDVASVEFPLRSMEEVSRLPQVIRWRKARRLRPLLDRSARAVGAREGVWSHSGTEFSGNTGQNVVVGFIDSGIDLQHKDFRRPDGQSRVVYLWDQTQSGLLRFPPEDFGYGMECTQFGIMLGGCPQEDVIGHGTHVAGIAVGNGSASGNGQVVSRYIGVAPEADLIVVKTDFLENHILEGINYIQARAESLGKPSVINLSLGSHIDPHDGTSLFARFLNNATGMGKIVVAAMGNEGDSDIAPIHVTGRVGQGGSVVVPFDIPLALEESPMGISIWYAGSSQLKVTVRGPKEGCVLSLDAPTTSETPISRVQNNFDVRVSSCGLFQLVSTSPQSFEVDPLEADNGDREILIILGTAEVPPSGGRWNFQLDGTVVVGNGQFDAWTEDAGFIGETGTEAPNVGSYKINPEVTLVNTATASEVISVGSTVNRADWPSQQGMLPLLEVEVGDISSFTSRGPIRSCSNTIACPSIPKPDLVAPGEWVMSSFSEKHDGSGCASNLSLLACLDPDGVHTVLRGTSMAAPHVAGAIALILQWHPEYTPEMVREVLLSNTQAPNGSSSNQWGSGILNVNLALKATPRPDGISPPRDLTIVEVGDQSLSLQWTPPSEFHVQGYNVFRSTTPGVPEGERTQVNTTPITSTSVSDTGLINGTTYYYSVEAVSTVSQQKSALSNVASGVPSARESDGGGCLITRLYGDPQDPRVVQFREVRDSIQKVLPGGEKIVRFYYHISPWVWKNIKNSYLLHTVIINLLNFFLFVLREAANILLGSIPLFLFLFTVSRWYFVSCYRMERC